MRSGVLLFPHRQFTLSLVGSRGSSSPLPAITISKIKLMTTDRLSLHCAEHCVDKEQASMSRVLPRLAIISLVNAINYIGKILHSAAEHLNTVWL